MELLTVQEMARRLGTPTTFVRRILYGNETKGAVRRAPDKKFCFEDVVAVIRTEAEK